MRRPSPTPPPIRRADPGMSSYGVEGIPGRNTGFLEANWADFLAQMDTPDFSGKRIAFFGLGAQERYPERFASSLMRLYEVFKGYTFEQSAVVVDRRFIGLVLDQRTQSMGVTMTRCIYSPLRAKLSHL